MHLGSLVKYKIKVKTSTCIFVYQNLIMCYCEKVMMYSVPLPVVHGMFALDFDGSKPRL